MDEWQFSLLFWDSSSEAQQQYGHPFNDFTLLFR
jgi:hypothetical protein